VYGSSERTAGECEERERQSERVSGKIKTRRGAQENVTESAFAGRILAINMSRGPLPPPPPLLRRGVQKPYSRGARGR